MTYFDDADPRHGGYGHICSESCDAMTVRENVAAITSRIVTEVRDLLAKAERGEIVTLAYVSVETDPGSGGLKFTSSVSEDAPGYEEAQYPLLGALYALIHTIVRDAVSNTRGGDA